MILSGLRQCPKGAKSQSLGEKCAEVKEVFTTVTCWSLVGDQRVKLCLIRKQSFMVLWKYPLRQMYFLSVYLHLLHWQ